MNTPEPGPVSTIGTNPTRLWGLTTSERVRRIAATSDLAGTRLVTNAAFAFDPLWLRHLARRPATVLTLGGLPVIASLRDDGDDAAAAAIIASIVSATPLPTAAGLELLAYEDGPQIENPQLRKREVPFVLPLRPDTVHAAERASYFGAYKGVTDLLTRYLWPEWALVLTRLCARAGITPNMVTALGTLLCVVATVCFADGRYWPGMALGLGFMVLDTVDGKLARCTITSSRLGNVLDHGLDLVHPPFWWWFWATGLGTWGLAYDSATFWWVQGAIQGGYWVQRLIEGVFMQRNGGIHIHAWRRFDSRFRLITARRNPNMVILFAATLLRRPDLGLIAVAWWTVISCAIHAVRLVASWQVRRREGAITSWLADPA